MVIIKSKKRYVVSGSLCLLSFIKLKVMFASAATPVRGRGSEPARKVSEPAGRAFALAGVALEPAGKALVPSGKALEMGGRASESELCEAQGRGGGGLDIFKLH